MSLCEEHVPDLQTLAEISAQFEDAPASTIVRWVYEEFGDDAVLAASFQDSVLVDIVARTAPDLEVVFLDTQYHFAQTLWYVEQVRNRYHLNLRVVQPLVDADDLWKTDVDGCCALRKVEPLNRALDGKRVWMSGLRRSETPTRAQAPIVSWDIGRGLVKVNPIANWSDADVDGYTRDHDLLVHPLIHDGYKSIGCWPCTKSVRDGDHARAGRWAGTDKIECGLHA